MLKMRTMRCDMKLMISVLIQIWSLRRQWWSRHWRSRRCLRHRRLTSRTGRFCIRCEFLLCMGCRARLPLELTDEAFRDVLKPWHEVRSNAPDPYPCTKHHQIRHHGQDHPSKEIIDLCGAVLRLRRDSLHPLPKNRAVHRCNYSNVSCASLSGVREA